MTATAYVSVDNGPLAPWSTVHVIDDDTTAELASGPVPERCPQHGWRLAPHRIVEALAELGWRPIDYYQQTKTAAQVTFAVEPMP